MNKNSPRISTALFALLFTIAGMTNAFAQVFAVGNFFYSKDYQNRNGVIVVGHVDGKNVKGKLVIPETIVHEGVTYIVTQISNSAFRNCIGVTSVTIPNSVKTILGFMDCTGLTAVNIPNSTTVIGSNAFSGCTRLTSIIIPNSVTTIGSNAFYKCSGLASITLPNSLTKIGYNAFLGTGWYNRQPEGILYLNCYCLGYKGNKPRGALNIQNNTRIIAENAFVDCTEITSVSIPNTVITIGAWAFNNCKGLASIVIPNSVTTIEAGAFKGCNKIKGELVIPNSVTAIGGAAFQECVGITAISVPSTVSSMGFGYGTIGSESNPFESTGWYDRQPNGILYLDNYCLGYKGNKPQGELRIKNGTRLIATNAFAECEKLISVFIPSSVTSIGIMAFQNCFGLTSVIIESHDLRELDFYDIFEGCDNLLEENIMYR